MRWEGKKKMKKLIFAVVSVLILSSCSPANRYVVERINAADSFSQQHKWKEAYLSVEDTLIFDGDPEMLRTLVSKYPDIISIGMKKVYQQRLNSFSIECNQKNFDGYRYAIMSLCRNKYAGEVKNEILVDSKKWLNECAANPKSSAWLKNLTDIEELIGTGYFAPETKRQAAITEENEKKAEHKNNTGIIINVQTANESHINNGAGAQMGAAVGQAQYVDNANWKNYSATKQLGAGLAGAVIGAMLLDQPSAPSYKATYFIQSLSGNINQIDITSSSPVHLPEGSCVEAHGNQISLINQDNCKAISVTKK